MDLKLTKILSSLTLLAAWAYALGWIKSFYYFAAFGVGLESVDLSVQDYLFASWYTVENVLFFILILWIAVITQRIWVYVVALLYLPIPFLTDWSYSHLSSPTWCFLFEWFVNVPHSILKFVPFVVLAIVLLLHKDARQGFRNSSWNQGNFALAVLSLIVIAWSISAAKHFGSSDAKRALRSPELYFLQVNYPMPETEEKPPHLYLLHYSTRRCILFSSSKFSHGAPIKVFYVPADRVDRVDGRFQIELEAGHLFW